MNRPLQFPPPLALKVIHLTEEEFRAALPHLEALRCRWAARPVEMWVPRNSVAEMMYREVPDDLRPHVRLVRPILVSTGPPEWFALVGGTEVILCPLLNGHDCGTQVELHLLDVLSNGKP